MRARRARSSTATVIDAVAPTLCTTSSYFRVLTIPAGVVTDSSEIALTVTLTSAFAAT